MCVCVCVREREQTQPQEVSIHFDTCYSTHIHACTGLSRLERWERASKLGLNPDPDVKKIINQHNGDSQYTEK